MDNLETQTKVEHLENLTEVLFHLFGGKNKVIGAWKKAHENLTVETLSGVGGLMGGELKAILVFDFRNEKK